MRGETLRHRGTYCITYSQTQDSYVYFEMQEIGRRWDDTGNHRISKREREIRYYRLHDQ